MRMANLWSEGAHGYKKSLRSLVPVGDGKEFIIRMELWCPQYAIWTGFEPVWKWFEPIWNRFEPVQNRSQPRNKTVQTASKPIPNRFKPLPNRFQIGSNHFQTRSNHFRLVQTDWRWFVSGLYAMLLLLYFACRQPITHRQSNSQSHCRRYSVSILFFSLVQGC